MRGRNLSGKNLTGANLKNANLTGTIFQGVTGMDRADLTGATMGNGTDFSGCDLTKTIFGDRPRFGSNPNSRTKFVGAKIPYTTLGAFWANLDLTGATIVALPDDLSRLNVRECNLTNISFAGKTLKNAHFSGSVLKGADFSNATLDNIVFSDNNDLSGAKFNGAQIPYGVFDKATLTRTDFTSARLDNSSFLETRMDGTKFDKTDVTTCSFSVPPRFSSDPTNLTSFKSATLDFSTLQKNWGYLDLTGATLVGLDKTVDLTYLQAQYAVLSGWDLSGYTLNQSDFTGAVLTSAKFSNAQMSNALLRGVRSICEIFRVPDSSGDYDTLKTALDGQSPIDVARIFANYGLVIPANTITINSVDAELYWTVTDGSTQITYSVITGMASDGSGYLSVLNSNLITVFDGAVLSNASFSPNNGQRSSLRGVSFKNATLTGADFSQVDMSRTNPRANPLKTPGDVAAAAQFQGAKMNNVALSRADLTGAQLTGGVLLHNADLSNSTLREADLSGAQLGGMSEVFRLAAASADYQPLLTALNGIDKFGVSTIFAKHGYPVTAAETDVIIETPDRLWSVADSSNQASYNVLKWASSDTTTYLVVSMPSSPAILTGAYMPDAVLTDANLYQVDGSHMHLYAVNKSADDDILNGAILDSANLSGANLGGINLKDASLYKATLSDANLIGAKLNRAKLLGASLDFADLQGADFTDAQLDNTSLSNASVSVDLSLTADSPAIGVFLFKLALTDAQYQDVLAELNVAQAFSLATDDDQDQMTADINALIGRNVSGLGPDFQTNGVTFSPQATITAQDWQGNTEVAWEIKDQSPPSGQSGDYRVWNGFDDTGDAALMAAPDFPALRQLFQDKATISLRWQATLTPAATAGRWTIDNDSENPNNLALGYVTYLAIQENDGWLSFYGTSLRIQRLSAANTSEIHIFTYHPTVLCKVPDGSVGCPSDGSSSYLGPDAVCPNTKKLSTNQAEGTPWPEMLRATQLPTPPACVPSPYAPCPQAD